MTPGKAVFVFVLLILHFVSYSQKLKLDFINLSFGGALPTGDFASKDIGNLQAGLAKPGLFGDLNVGCNLYSILGVQAQVRYQSNPFNSKAFLDIIVPILPPGVTADIGSSSWHATSFMVGPYASISIGDDLLLEPRAMLGFHSMKKPALDFEFSNNFFVKQTSANANGLGYLIGAGVKYLILSPLFVLGNIDYSSNNLTYKGIVTTSSTGSTQTIAESKRPFDSFNVSIGIGYKFE